MPTFAPEVEFQNDDAFTNYINIFSKTNNESY